MSIRWNIKDRATGDHLVLDNPQQHYVKGGYVAVHEEQADKLRSIIKNCSAVGISPMGRAKHHG